jgi:hypothetical protein
MKTDLFGGRVLFLVSLSVLFLALPVSYAAQIWNGPSITFTKLNNADWTQPTNQDRITSTVWLTRKTTQGLYNIALESGYTQDFSPAGTEWAYGHLTNYASLSYAAWSVWNGQNPPSMTNRDAVLHLTNSNIYLAIKFTSWSSSGGGFAYVRSTAPVNLATPAVAGTNFQFSFPSISGHTYTVQSRTNLVVGAWQTRTNISGDGTNKTVRFPLDRSAPQFFHLSIN